MNLTLHLVCKDLRRLQRTSVLWVLLLVGQVITSHRLVSNSGGTFDWDWFTKMNNLSILLLSLGLLVTFLLIGMMVLEDPLVGTKMFWVSRPINGGRLLVAKLITAFLLFVVLPIMIWMPWWLLCDFSFKDIKDAVLGIAQWQLLIAIPAFTLASLASSVGRFLLMSILLAMGVSVGLMNFLGQPEATFALRVSRVVVAAGLLGVTAIGMTILMYRTRRISRALLFLGVGVILAAAVGMKWPFELGHWFSRQPNLARLENSSEIGATIESARLERRKKRDGLEQDYLTIKVRVKDIPETLGLRGGRADVGLHWADGTAVEIPEVDLGSSDDSTIPLYHAFGLKRREATALEHWDAETAEKIATERAKTEARIARRGIRGISFHKSTEDPYKDRPTWLIGNVAVSEEIAEKIRKEPPACIMNAKIEADVPAVLGEIPLEAGSVIANHGRIELLNFRMQSGQRPYWREGYGVFSVFRGPAQVNGVNFYQVDRKHQGVGLIFRDSTQPIAPVTGRLNWMVIHFSVPHLWRTDRWVEEPDWQNDFRIGVVVFEPAGFFERSLKSERLNLESPEEMPEKLSNAASGTPAD